MSRHRLLVDAAGGAAADAAAENAPCFVFAHGAGAAMDSGFMNRVAAGLAAAAVQVVRFEFPYMAERRATGKRRPPNPTAQLLACWREVIAEVGSPGELFIGGKSMGGRMASLCADELGVKGLCCLGYPFHPPGKPFHPPGKPFHPPGKPDRLRTAHLQSVRTPTLIVQGERDPFGGRDEIAGFALDPAIRFAWMPDGDHSFAPRKRSGFTAAGNLEVCIAAVAGFVHGR